MANISKLKTRKKIPIGSTSFKINHVLNRNTDTIDNDACYSDHFQMVKSLKF